MPEEIKVGEAGGRKSYQVLPVLLEYDIAVNFMHEAACRVNLYALISSLAKKLGRTEEESHVWLQSQLELAFEGYEVKFLPVNSISKLVYEYHIYSALNVQSKKDLLEVVTKAVTLLQA